MPLISNCHNKLSRSLEKQNTWNDLFHHRGKKKVFLLDINTLFLKRVFLLKNIKKRLNCLILK